MKKGLLAQETLSEEPVHAEASASITAAEPVSAVSASAAAWIETLKDSVADGLETTTDIEVLLQRLVARLEGLRGEIVTAQRDALHQGEEVDRLRLRAHVLEEKILGYRESRLAAQCKVQSLTKTQANELKVINKHPPNAVRRTFEALYTLMNCGRWAKCGADRLECLDVKKEWPKIQQMLVKNDFVQTVLTFDVDALDAAPHVAELVAEKYFPTMHLTLPQVLSPPTSPGRAEIAVDWPSAVSSQQRTKLRRQGMGKAPESLPTVSSSACHRNVGIASVAAARLLGPAIGPSRPLPKVGNLNFRSTDSVSELPMDVASITHASTACGALALWLSEVLSEFFALRGIRKERDELHARLEVALQLQLKLQENTRQLEEERSGVDAEHAYWRVRIADLRRSELAVGQAQANLEKLSRLEGGQFNVAPNFNLGLSRTGRGRILGEPLSPQRCTASLASLPRGPPPAPKEQWPAGRKYLHIMSAPALPQSEEALDVEDCN